MLDHKLLDQPFHHSLVLHSPWCKHFLVWLINLAVFSTHFSAVSLVLLAALVVAAADQQHQQPHQRERVKGKGQRHQNIKRRMTSNMEYGEEIYNIVVH